MDTNPAESETILQPVSEPEPEPEPVSVQVEAFRQGKAKREAKRKEVKVITTHVPPPVAPEPPRLDADDIAGRVAEILLSKMAEDVGEEEEDEKKVVRRKKKASPAPAPAPSIPPTKSFGWC